MKTKYKKSKCSECNGLGYTSIKKSKKIPSDKICHKCDGTGMIKEMIVTVKL